MIDDRTPHLDLGLPHAGNKLAEDIARMRATLLAIDNYLFTLQNGLSGVEDSIGSDIASLVGGKVPAEQLPNTDALTEGLTNLFFTDARARAALQAATSTVLGGIKVGSGLSVGLDGTLSTIGSGSGEGLPAFNELVLTPSTNGQTTFTPVGGYEPGNIDLYLNGVFLVGNGVNYTASNGTTIVLATGVNTSDRLLLRRWTTTDSLPFSALLSKPTTLAGYGITDGKEFPSGTRMLFVQSAAPAGWTKDTTHNNKALRVVSGTAGSGGSLGFTTAFGSRAINGSVGDTTLALWQIPSHRHGFIQRAGSQGSATGTARYPLTELTDTQYYTDYQGGSGAHNHTFTGTNLDLSVAYVDTIIATKD